MEQEGVIKFKLDFEQTNALPADNIAELNAWRDVMVQLQMIGQTPMRYDNYGFGNISRRLHPREKPRYAHPFVITGTQTGGLERLTAVHYAIILDCFPEENRVVAEGPMKPSSESMTHGMIYAQNREINWVMHAHEPIIWRHAEALGIPVTAPTVSYGSPEMSAEVVRLFAETAVYQRGIFTMAGHDDGVVTFGKTAEEAGQNLLNYLAKGYVIEARD
ncbi:MAG: class II aldolase/adducin family protein [Chloroflexota bacterium]